MAEKLGEAVLDLMTNDAAFMAGVNKAEAAANGLGKTLDACSGSSVKLAAEITEAANAGNRGAQAWLAAGTAIERLATAQVDAETEINNAKAALNAGSISLEQYKRQVLETQSALAVFEEEHRRAQAELRKTIAANKEVTAANGAQRQGLLQLTQQLGDVSTMYALGARPAQIFASQIGQVAQSIQLMGGEGSKLARFLGGPWGIAISAAVIVLGPLIGNLLSARDALDQVKLAASNLSNVQGALGQVFDLTTGKIKDQTEATRALARATLELAKAEAQKKLSDANRTIAASGEKQFVISGGLGGGLYMGRERPIEGQIESQYRNGVITGSQAIDKLENLYKRGLITQDRYLELVGAYSGALVEKGNVDRADQALGDLKSGRVSSQFLQPEKNKRKGKTGKTQDEIDGEFLQAIEGLNRDELQAKLAIATDANERLEIQKQLLESERAAKIAEIEHNKDFTAAQKQAMKAVVDRLYGRPGQVDQDGNIVSEGRPGLLNQGAMRNFEQEQTRLANDMLQRQAQTAQAWAQTATSSLQRAELEAEALRLQQQIQTNLLEQQIATGQVADAERARAELRSQQEAERKGLSQRNAGPLEQYRTQLESNKEDSGRRVEALIVQELDYVHRSITDTISSRLGVEDPLLKGLIDMFIENILIRPLANALAGASGSGGGVFSALFGGLGADGGGSILSAGVRSVGFGGGANADGTLSFAGLFAGGGLIPDGAWGIVGDAGPEPIRATAGGIEVLPNSSLRALGGGDGGRPGTLKVEINGARGNREIQEMVREGVAQGLAAYDEGVAGRVREQSDRRS